MNIENIIFPQDFLDKKIAICFPEYYLMQLKEICSNNNLEVWNPDYLKEWVEEYAAEDGATEIYVYRKHDTEEVCCFKEGEWRQSVKHLKELELHQFNEFFTKEVLCQSSESLTSILDLL